MDNCFAFFHILPIDWPCFYLLLTLGKTVYPGISRIELISRKNTINLLGGFLWKIL